MKDKKIFEKKISDLISNYNSGFFLKASRQAKSLLEKNKDDYQLCNIYGIILLKLQKTQIATRYFQSSIKLKPDFFEAHFNLLKTFYDLKKYDKVILQSKACLKLNPRSVETLILLGNLYQKLEPLKLLEIF